MLRVDHIRKEFGNVRAVRDVSFEVPRGSTFGLLGPNGAGKTTTMRIILGILPADGGSVEWNGEPIGSRMRRRFGYLPEERGLYGKMKVRDQIKYFGRLHGLSEPAITQRTDRWIERLGLGEYAERPAAELSKGNQQKVQVACAAVHEPELLILDEPFSGLDPVNAEILFGLLAELRDAGTTLILSSHQMWQLEQLCSSFSIIADGEDRVAGTLAQLRAGLPTRVVRVAPGTPVVERELRAVAGGQPLPTTDGECRLVVPSAFDVAPLLRKLVESEQISRFEVVEPSLQEIYLRAIEEAA